MNSSYAIGNCLVRLASMSMILCVALVSLTRDGCGYITGTRLVVMSLVGISASADRKV